MWGVWSPDHSSAHDGQPKRTSPSTQARHWVAEVLFTAMIRQAEGDADGVAVAFPEFDVYTRLLRRIEHATSKLGLTVLAVQESGAVVIIQEGDLSI